MRSRLEGLCKSLNFCSLCLTTSGYRADNSSRREARTACSVFIGSRDFIQISRHSIKQSIYSGFAFTGTSRFPATSTTCKFVGICSNSSRLGTTSERERESENRLTRMVERVGWYSHAGVCWCTHTANPRELAFPLGPLLEAARTMATECLPTLTQSTSSTYAYPQNPVCGRTTWNFLDSTFTQRIWLLRLPLSLLV